MSKKLGFLVSLVVLAAMILAACGTSSNNNQNNAGTPGAAGTAALGTPGAEGNGTPASNGAAGSGQVTPAAGIATQTAAPGAAAPATQATALSGTPSAAAGTAAAVTTGTPAAAGTAAATGTAGASVPVTSANTCQFNRLTKFTGMTVVNPQNQEVGQVKDVVVVRDTSVFNTSMNTNGNTANSNNANGNNASANGQANGQGTANNPKNNASANGQANGTGTAKGNAQGAATPGGVVMSSGQGLEPMVDYVVVDLAKDFGGKTVLVPFTSFKFNHAVAENKAAEAGAAVTTSVAGAAKGTPVATAAANGGTANATATANDCVATLNVTPTALSSLPAFDASKVDFTAANWDQQYRSFWASQGGVIPATGNSKYGMPVMLGDKVSDIHVKDSGNEDLGEVKDFIIDPTTGRLSWAALGTGGVLGIGQKIVLIPMTAMNWVSNGQNDKADNGFLSINLTKDQVQAAPTVDDLDKVDFSAANWSQNLMSYWKTFGASTSPSQQVATPGAPPSK